MFEEREDSPLKHYLQSFSMIFSRNMRRWLRFKVSFYTYMLSCVADAVFFGFLGRLIARDSAALSAWGGDYLAFALVGLTFEHILLSSMSSVYNSVSSMFDSGRLEHILVSPLPLHVFILADVASSLLRSSIVATVYLIVGIFFDAKMMVTVQTIGLISGHIAVALVGMVGLGMISGAMFWLINAKGQEEPVKWFVFTINKLVAGVTIPVSLLPRGLQYFSLMLPQTYALDSARRLLLADATLSGTLLLHLLSPTVSPLAVNATALVALSVLWVIIGSKLFSLAIRKAQQDGTLTRWA